MKDTVKKLLPHLIAYFLLLAITFIYFYPIVFEGKTLQQSDNIQARGMQAEARDILEQTGKLPLWTNAMFSGMPTYQILFGTDNGLKYVSKTFLLGNDMAPPHTGILLMMAGVYLLLIILRVDWRISIVGAVAFGLSADFMDLVLAGHSTKIIALAYTAPIFAGIILTMRGKYLLGGALTALFLGLQLFANHLQITYYTFLFSGILGLVYLLQAIRQGTYARFFTAMGVLVIAAGLAVGSSASRLWTTYEYSQETIRGESELTQKSGSSGSTAGESGLSKEYAFGWSYGINETLTLFVPNFMGFSSTDNFVANPDGSFNPNSATSKALQQLGDQQQAQQLVQLASHYWGDQPFVGGPMYFGVVILFLFFLGAYLVNKPIKYFLIIGAIFSIMLAWGKNFSGFNYFLFDYLPMYNKFRAVKMAMDVGALLVVALGALGLQAFVSKNIAPKNKLTGLYVAGGITGGVILLILLFSGTMNYGTEGLNAPARFIEALRTDRAALLRADAFRSLLLVALSFGLLWITLRQKWLPATAVLGIGLLVLFDMWGVANRFVSSGDFVRKRDLSQLTEPAPVDEQLMADPDPYFRVADFRRNPWANAITSYHHKSVGGYHAAKLMRYQELIEGYLGDPNQYDHVYGMLNTKYFISPQGQATRVPTALGNAWFVKEYEVVETADAEYDALENLQPGEKAILQSKYASYLDGLNLQFDSTANIQLTSYHPDTLVYRYSAQSEQLAVFSEVYYPPSKGWDVYLDGERVDPFIKVDFLLRALRLPAGQNHELKMVFAPRSYHTGENISLASSWLIILLTLGGLVLYFRNHTVPSTNHLPEPEPEPAPRKGKKKVVKKKRK